MNLEERIKRVRELDGKRTQGEWIMRQSAANPRAGDFVKNYGVDADFPNGQMRDICRDIFAMDEDRENMNFIAQAPAMVQIISELLELVKVQHEALYDVFTTIDDDNRIGFTALQDVNRATEAAQPLAELWG